MTTPFQLNRIQILGVNFSNETTPAMFESITKSGGLLLIPSGPGMASIDEDSDYYRSLLKADFVIADSGYMVLLWNSISRKKIRRVSGLEFLTYFLDQIDSESNILTVDPDDEESIANRELLLKKGFQKVSCYEAPYYKDSKCEDPKLLKLIVDSTPEIVLINIAGGKQEKLGYYLRQNLNFKPIIICSGAAIAFLTGQQVRIPMWADKLFLGWLLRIISKPKSYFSRYWTAFRLAGLLFRYRDNPVPAS